MLELRLLFGFAKVTVGKNSFNCNKEKTVTTFNKSSFFNDEHLGIVDKSPMQYSQIKIKRYREERTKNLNMVQLCAYSREPTAKFSPNEESHLTTRFFLDIVKKRTKNLQAFPF